MVKLKLFTAGLVLLLIQSTALFAQDDGYGRIEGTVTDAVNQEALIGVNVMIQGTSLGSASDIDGNFVIRRVPAGQQTVIVSYIGYDQVQEVVQIEDGETLELDFELSPTTVEGEEIVISSQAEGQKRAINEQISARQIKNVVSAEKIRELPDESAATALSRLPGVSLQEGDKVVVRGIQAKMNTIMVNGVQLPSTDLNDRSTNLGFISSNMLSGIEVTKAVTPDMDANSIGGVINLRLQEAPEDFHFDVMAQGGYNTQDDTKDNYQVWGSVSNRFFDDKLGAFFQVNARRENAGQDYSQANFTLISDTPEPPPYGEAKYGMESFSFGDQVRITDQRGGSLILDYKLPNGKLALQNTYAYTENDFTEHRDVMQFSPVRRQLQIRRDIHSKHLLVNALQGEHDFDVFEIDYGISRAYSEKDTDLRYGEDYGFAFVNSTEVPYPGNFSRERRLQMTPQDVYDLELNPAYTETASFWQNGATRDQAFNETITSGQLNVTIPVTFSESISGEFKTGGMYKVTERENDLQRTTSRITENPLQSNRLAEEWMREQGIDPTVAPQFADFKDYDYGDDRGADFLGGNYVMDDVMDTDLMDKYIRLASPAWGVHKADSEIDDYTGKETLSAGYGMFDFSIGNKIEILGGVRYENLRSEYDANMVLLQQAQDGTSRIPNEEYDTPEVQSVADSLTTADRSVGHFFPNLQLRYKITDWMDLRLAYTETISRPDYSAIVPNIYYESPSIGSTGNPNLKPSESFNYDAYLSFYTNKVGLFTVGAFYKKIENMFIQETRFYENLDESIVYPSPSEIERINYQEPASKGNITTYFNNSNPAYLRGFELDWQTHFWYLPKPLNLLVLNVNYTRVFSEMDYDQTIYENETVCDPRCSVEVTAIDTVRSARLIQQGDHIINAALGADYKGFSGRVSFRMQGDVITNVATRPELDAFTGNIYGWDVTIRQQLPVDGLSLFLNGLNIGHLPTKDYQKFRREDDGDILRNLRRTSYNPRRFQIGIRYSY
ncbi:TonB-dependent receptor [Gracilimonas mengyeensis]|uniref:TonB-dependent receptor n=1 Tax=Gracilimonas mengyeensis TaxID=1302730 RepID=A0A521B691_9BACT|nr:TonB-dependent receptor [Gracilimonas mengyeensis]SMO42586.1 TonB-dependent receptor [Gracilimonas mengyeensis]